MTKVALFFVLALGVIGATPAWATECNPDTVKEQTEYDCHVHSADGVVDCSK